MKQKRKRGKHFEVRLMDFRAKKRSKLQKVSGKACQKLPKHVGCRMSVKLRFLSSHLDFFQENLGDFSKEHGERFHENIEPMERQYKSRWDSTMMRDFI